MGEVSEIDNMTEPIGRSKKAGSDSENSDDEDQDDFVKRRDKFVNESIKKTVQRGSSRVLLEGSKNPVAAELRREIIRNFFKDVGAVKKCSFCSGFVLTVPTCFFPLTGFLQDISSVPER